MEDAHVKTVEEIQNYFNVDPEKGLSPDQVKRNQEKYGLNGEYAEICSINVCFGECIFDL